ncbi:MAG: molybdopterin-dependent oxidoreductase [Acetobacteraceae bacterium]|nr:molybdopterin-dependent oxidoreductase [Acetobacteraceae bacterium]
MDLVASVLGLEPAEVRRRNIVHPEQMPYPMGIPYRDGEPMVYDSGDFLGAVEKVLEAVGGLSLHHLRCLFPGAGYGDDLCASGGRHLVG